MYASPAGGLTKLPCTYGFSIVFTSIALPYACSDHRLVPLTNRQLKADVLSAAIEAWSSPPYTSTVTIRRIGKRASYSRWKTVVIASTASALTISDPGCDCPSKPQYDSRMRRSRSGPTGQPAWYDAPRSPAVTVDTEDENAGAGATGPLEIGTRPLGAVSIGGDAAGAVVVVVDVEVDVVVVVDVLVVVDDVVGGAVVVVVGVRALSDELHAAHAISSSTHVTFRPRPRRTPS
jgi:hypothetical protein